ncbi:minor tail protein [Gordonia phage DumpTruck]|nr:minor tail protein [Gordonia phage DumpTruck]
MTRLKEGQYKIGNLLMGAGTPIQVTKFEPQGYDANVNDLPRDRVDEVSFGQDSYAPKPIALEGAVLNLYDVFRGPDYPISGQVPSHRLMDQLFAEWRADDVRRTWGNTKPLHYKKAGPQKIIYGRPRKINRIKAPKGSDFIPFVMEYMPMDLLEYSYEEHSMTVNPNAAGAKPNVLVRNEGEAPSWFRAVITGPATNIKILFGNLWEIDLAVTLAAGKLLEISAQPWLRRVVDSDSFNWSAKLVGNSAYLDEMRIPPWSSTNWGFSCTGSTSATKCLVTWRDAYFS